MLVRFIDGPSKGMTRDVPFLTAQTLFARQMAVDERLARIADAPKKQALPEVGQPESTARRRLGRKDRPQ